MDGRKRNLPPKIEKRFLGPVTFMQLQDLLNSYRQASRSEREKGDYFEPYVNTNYAGGSVSACLYSGHYIG